MKKIKNAIIIHGPGRSGTTLLSNILSLHNELGWISGYVNRYPNLINLTVLNRLQNISFIEKFSRWKRKFPRPSEAYNFWLHYIPEFNESNFDKISENSTNNAINSINKVLKKSGKNRFITKITGNARHQSLEAIFDNPYIIWLDRNPESVIMSYYKQKWRYKNKNDVFEQTPKKTLILQYVKLYNHFQSEKEFLKKFNFKEFNYEDLVIDKHDFFKKICEFINLPYNDKLHKIVNDWTIKSDTNSSFKSLLNENEYDYLKQMLKQN